MATLNAMHDAQRSLAMTILFFKGIAAMTLKSNYEKTHF